MISHRVVIMENFQILYLVFWIYHHVLFAVDTYWYLIKWVHRQIGVSQEEFHMHYNLSPWISSEVEKIIRNIAATYNGFIEDYIAEE